MDIIRHLAFCPPGTPYFDAPVTGASDADDFPAAHADLPEGWTRTPGAEWVVLTPPDTELPRQGWKIHVSATLDNAEHVLDVVLKYCTAERVMFKFIRGLPVLKRRNGKYGDRSGSGKFVTIYPVDDAHFARVLDELGAMLDGEPGPYILSDLRWRDGPLYVRYGGFVLQAVRADSGELVYCIENPDGELVPDRRGPGFRPPEWVTLPECLSEAVATRNSGTLHDFPYRVTRALHFSNGGGVYRGVDTRTGADVLLREARPHAGLDGDGRDAVARHRQEHWALQRLHGLPCIPEPIDYRKGHEHYFLVRQYVEGTALSKEMIRRNPLVQGRREPEEFAAYAQWALGVLDRIDEGVRGMHERGVVFGDLHPGNILVGPDGSGDRVAFIDFETASDVADEATQHMGAVGFMAPAGYTGRAVDRYALGCLRLALFAPLAGAVAWSPEKVEQLLGVIGAHYPVPDGFAEQVRSDLGPPADKPGGGTEPAATGAAGADGRREAGTGASPSGRTAVDGGSAAPDGVGRPLWGTPRDGDWHGLRTELAEGVLAGATPERPDRLFPGDAEQFFSPLGGAGFAHGAAGVLWALDRAGLAVREEHLDWLTRAARAVEEPTPGFFRGLGGIAFALDALGRTDEARELLDRGGRAADLDRLDAGLYDGLAGVGLTGLHLGRRTGDRELLDAAHEITDRLLEHEEQKTAPGLARGASGGALFLLRMYEHTGDTALLDRAEQWLRADLEGLGWTADGFGRDAAGRLPMIGTGCGGTGMVLHDLLAHRPDQELARARDAVLDATALAFTPQAGLFHGRAGVVQVLLHLTGGRADAERLRPHLAGFGLHAVRDGGHPAFLGQECLRISHDLATGTSGVLLALGGALTDRQAWFPFF